MSNVNRPKFIVGEFNKKELELIEYQKEVLTKLDKDGFGVKIEEDSYLPIPALLKDNNFPVELFQHKNNLLLCFNSWKELEEYVSSTD